MKKKGIRMFNNIRLNLLAIVVVLVTTQAYTQTYTFTTAGATGNIGPTQGSVNTAYSSTTLNGSVTVIGSGIQEFTVAGGLYRITAWGASGGNSTTTPMPAGYGASIEGEFILSPGDVIRVLVGQMGQNSNYAGSGGGATFVTKTPHNTLASVLIVAGGGGGATADFPGLSAVTATCGTFDQQSGPAQCNGDGGISFTGNSGGGGGGFFTNGQNGGIGFGGVAYVNGGQGGANATFLGGFGGGASQSTGGTYAGNGGGGFSGGNGGNRASTAGTGRMGGGGGGSYNSGTNQLNAVLAANGDGRVVITKLCNVNVSASNNPVCFGTNVTLSTDAITTVSWSTGSSTSSSITVTPSVNTTYYVTGTGSNNCLTTAAIEVSVVALPNIASIVNPTMLCVGATASVVSSGASTYTLSSGPSGSLITVNPLTTTPYTITGTNGFGCINSTTVSVVVNSNSLSVSPNTVICEGAWVDLSATGANTYTWSTGAPLQSIQASPSVSTVYSVTGTDVFSCQFSNSVSVIVNPLPNVVAGSDKNTICKGEMVILNATGANTYAWSNPVMGPATGSMLPLTLLIDVPYTYSVTGTDNNGCKKSDVITIIVAKCAGVEELKSAGIFSRIFPNPGNGIFTVEFLERQPGTIEILDCTGRIIFARKADTEKTIIDLSAFADGIYYVKVNQENSFDVIKIIKGNN